MKWAAPTRRLIRPHLPLPAERFGLDEGAAESILRQVEEQYLGPRAGATARRQFRAKLHLDDLMLARACAAGIESAWEVLWSRYQPRLRRAALAITREASRAEELADGLLADLFGMQTRNGERVSKLTSFTGIGSLEGWLCALLARTHVDGWRRERLLTGLEELETAAALRLCVQPEPVASSAQRQVESALEGALSRVDGPGRLLLSLYFLDGKTLAEIGALLQVHESTVSRRLERVLNQLRRQTRRGLGGLGPAAWDESAQLDPRWLQVDVRKALGVAAPGGGSAQGV
jgi:RNA polymerase sigma-70 factor (ECF subfamily)